MWVCVCTLHARAANSEANGGGAGMKSFKNCVWNNHPPAPPHPLADHPLLGCAEGAIRPIWRSPPRPVPKSWEWISIIYTCVHRKTSQVRVRLELFCKHRFTNTLQRRALYRCKHYSSIIGFARIHNKHIYIPCIICHIYIVHGFVINDYYIILYINSQI